MEETQLLAEVNVTWCNTINLNKLDPSSKHPFYNPPIIRRKTDHKLSQFTFEIMWDIFPIGKMRYLETPLKIIVTMDYFKELYIFSVP